MYYLLICIAVLIIVISEYSLFQRFWLKREYFH